ncbi:PadR family transcriptional regulator [Alteribacter aurantiacus]|uniref:PadR family transcriptional regulator n=1 Tax=Alteribacter aurantiacus TaxID=254410 RepID=UPI00040EC4F6|nr:PadR family transcriptional regulator [Alteribacter aurantiacus]
MKSNHTKYAILGLLTTGCHTGYTIKKMIDGSLNHFWKISYGQIYPILKLLAEEGLASVSTLTQEGKPDKKEYKITPKGERALKEWLEIPVTDMSPSKNELLLKLFFSRHQAPSIILAHLHQHQVILNERIATYESIENMIKTTHGCSTDARFWIITLDYGKRTARAELEWCEDTIKQFH